MTDSDRFKILTLQDYGKVVEIFDKVFPAKFKAEFEKAWCLRATVFSFGIWREKELEGFVICRDRRGESDSSLRIEFLGVNPSGQNKGIGTMLLKHVLQFAANQGITRIDLVPVENPRIINWYQKNGFEFSGESWKNPWTGELERQMVFVGESRNPHPSQIASQTSPCQPVPCHTC